MKKKNIPEQKFRKEIQNSLAIYYKRMSSNRNNLSLQTLKTQND